MRCGRTRERPPGARHEHAPLLDGPPVKVGVFGGTGLYSMDGLTGLREVAVATPFGDPSAVVTVGELDGVRVAFIPRHGRGHRILPSEIPARANVYAMKLLGVERLISISAVGSLREYIKPLHMVVPDQIIDRTQARPNTFFGEGLAVHIAFGEPFCAELSGMLAEAAAGTGRRCTGTGRTWLWRALPSRPAPNHRCTAAGAPTSSA